MLTLSRAKEIIYCRPEVRKFETAGVGDLVSNDRPRGQGYPLGWQGKTVAIRAASVDVEIGSHSTLLAAYR